eukprot:TRINITY_DN6682_c0_g1_i3.p4 TRINITY_DN6682_c0_g1~~TRINITY_DN6682_c0_g1_i3.p4  ORF type:complete len:120 (+),score=9.50 TRINITY_DN6682_c0_g1_i3:636-995(+)
MHTHVTHTSCGWRAVSPRRPTTTTRKKETWGGEAGREGEQGKGEKKNTAKKKTEKKGTAQKKKTRGQKKRKRERRAKEKKKKIQKKTNKPSHSPQPPFNSRMRAQNECCLVFFFPASRD